MLYHQPKMLYGGREVTICALEICKLDIQYNNIYLIRKQDIEGFNVEMYNVFGVDKVDSYKETEKYRMIQKRVFEFKISTLKYLSDKYLTFFLSEPVLWRGESLEEVAPGEVLRHQDRVELGLEHLHEGDHLTARPQPPQDLHLSAGDRPLDLE